MFLKDRAKQTLAPRPIWQVRHGCFIVLHRLHMRTPSQHITAADSTAAAITAAEQLASAGMHLEVAVHSGGWQSASNR